jgi:hypothetical protein
MKIMSLSIVEVCLYIDNIKLNVPKSHEVQGLCDSVLRYVLVGKPEGKRPLGGPRHRWLDNMKMDGMV